MKTFLQIAKENKAHEFNRLAMFNDLKEKETISVDFGIDSDGESTFSIDVWNKAGNAVLDSITMDVTDGVVIRRDNSLNDFVTKTIISILEEYPDEVEFGVESFNWEDEGYIYAAEGGYGNMAEYRSREYLEYLLTA